LQSDDVITLIDVFRENLSELENEVTALSTIKTVLQIFITRLSESVKINIKPDLLSDDTIVKIVDSLTLSKINFKEEKSMEELNKANESLGKLLDKSVRIIYLPPATVASSQFTGENPEDVAGGRLNEFIRATELHKLKPDLRMYGFNNPCPKDNQSTYGYEFWVTIPEDMVVPDSLEKKQFEGGLYAAHCIKMGDFEEWKLFSEWIINNDNYTYDCREPLGMHGSLEEHLNVYNFFQKNKEKAEFIQLDLLIPIKEKLL